MAIMGFTLVRPSDCSWPVPKECIKLELGNPTRIGGGGEKPSLPVAITHYTRAGTWVCTRVIVFFEVPAFFFWVASASKEPFAASALAGRPEGPSTPSGRNPVHPHYHPLWYLLGSSLEPNQDHI